MYHQIIKINFWKRKLPVMMDGDEDEEMKMNEDEESQS